MQPKLEMQKSNQVTFSVAMKDESFIEDELI
jgi:hypothetical protein